MEERRDKEKIQTLDIYTDGSLKNFGMTVKFGGWAYIAVRDNVVVHSDCGNKRLTTNQRMELTAVAEALKYASAFRTLNEKVVIYSDSAYIINCYLKEWYINWINNGWMNSNRKPVANQDLWEQIVPYFDNFWYTFRKVEAHAGVYWNEQCDSMAQQKADRLARGLDKE